MENVLKREGLVNEILYKKLGKITDYLPSHGIVAGGAVANTILSIVWGKELPINDVDIFLTSNTCKKMSLKLPNDTYSGTTPVRELPIPIDETDREAIGEYVRPDFGSSYSIKSTWTEGLLNYVLVEIMMNNKKLTVENIVNGFDLNCCQVGINLETQELFYTDEFAKFIETKQLKVINPYTPFHTAGRMLQKVKDLECYCDVEKEMTMLCQVPLMFRDPYHQTKRIFAPFFGRKYYDLINDHIDVIGQYFDILTYQEAKMKNKEITSIKDYVDSERAKRTKKDEAKLWTLSPKEHIKLSDDILKYVVQTSRVISIKKFSRIWNLVNNYENKTELNRIRKILDSGINVRLLNSRVRGFHKCNFDAKHLKTINVFLEDNPQITSIIGRFGYNVQQTLNFIKTLKKLVKVHGSVAISIISEKLIRLNNWKINASPEYLGNLINQEKKNKSVLLTEPINLDNFMLKDKVRELTTEWDLMWQGKIMRNCISNNDLSYAQRLKRGEIKLFEIKTENSTSLIEFKLGRYELVYIISQHYAKFNRNINEMHKEIGQFLCQFLTYENIQKEFDTHLNDYKDKCAIIDQILKKSDDSTPTIKDCGYARRDRLEINVADITDNGNEDREETSLRIPPPPPLEVGDTPEENTDGTLGNHVNRIANIMRDLRDNAANTMGIPTERAGRGLGDRSHAEGIITRVDVLDLIRDGSQAIPVPRNIEVTDNMLNQAILEASEEENVTISQEDMGRIRTVLSTLVDRIETVEDGVEGGLFDAVREGVEDLREAGIEVEVNREGDTINIGTEVSRTLGLIPNPDNIEMVDDDSDVIDVGELFSTADMGNAPAIINTDAIWDGSETDSEEDNSEGSLDWH